MKISYRSDAKKYHAKETVLVTLVPEATDTFVFLDNKKRHMQIGVGKPAQMTRRKLILLVRRIVKLAKANKLKKLEIPFADFRFPKIKSVSDEELASLIAENLEMANFEFVKFKEKPKDGWRFVEEMVLLDSSKQSKKESAVKKGIARGKKVGEAVNETRALSNTPGGDMTPKLLARAARSAARLSAPQARQAGGAKVRVRVLGRAQMKKEKMGAILGVAKGSKEEPQFIVLEYLGGKKGEKPIVLVGKGVTFDTGGLNLKPSQGIYEMHMDMSGGAAVIHATVLAAKLGIKKNVVALIPAAENMVSGESFRPGDVLKSMSGKTIEVLNTDAEGRLIVADALTYAAQYKPRLVVDVATLTGAAISALGQRASAILTKDEKLQKLFQELGEETGEYVWPLPLWEEYLEDTKGIFADIANVPANGSAGGGTINGAAFLAHFAKGYPWVHMDIAPRMTSISEDNLAKGAAGAPVRLLIKLLEKY